MPMTIEETTVVWRSADRVPGPRGLAHLGALACLFALAGVLLAACGQATTLSGPGYLRFSCGTLNSRSVVTVSPLQTSDAGAGQVLRIGVCIGGQGPYPFVVDSGATTSVIDTGLAHQLGLRGVGSTDLGGFGCTVTAPEVAVPAMRTKGTALASQDMADVRLGTWAGVAADGVLGSDVLWRFGAVRIDFIHDTLSVAGPEGPAPKSNVLVEPVAGAKPPVNLVNGAPGPALPMRVVEGPGAVGAFVDVSVGGKGPYPFIVDTGSPISAVAASLASSAHMASVSQGTVPPAGVGCTASVPLVVSPTLKVGETALAANDLRSVEFAGLQRSGIIGAIGLDALSSSGSIVINYSGAELTVGAG